MDSLAVLLADWPTVIAVLEKKSAIASDEENAAIWRRIAETKLDMLEDVAGAVAAYEQALELDPESAATVDALIALYEPRDERQAARRALRAARRAGLRGRGRPPLRPQRPRRRVLREAARRPARGHRRARRRARRAPGRRGGARLAGAPLPRRGDVGRAARQPAAPGRAPPPPRRSASRCARPSATSTPSKLDEPERRARAVPPRARGRRPRTTTPSPRRAAIGEAREELRLDAADILEPVLRAGSAARGARRHPRAAAQGADRAGRSRPHAPRHRRHRGRGPRAGPAAPRPRCSARSRTRPRTPRSTTTSRSMCAALRGLGPLRRRARARARAPSSTPPSPRTSSSGSAASPRRSSTTTGAPSRPTRRPSSTRATQPELLEALDRLHGRLGDKKALADVLERRVAARGQRQGARRPATTASR